MLAELVLVGRLFGVKLFGKLFQPGVIEPDHLESLTSARREVISTIIIIIVSIRPDQIIVSRGFKLQ